MTANQPVDEIILLKERVADLTELCRQRGVSMTLVKDLYRDNGFQTAASWERLVEKLAALDTTKQFSLATLANKLEGLASKSIWFDDKAVRIYEISPQEAEAAIAAFSVMSSQSVAPGGTPHSHGELGYSDVLDSDEIVIYQFKTTRTFIERSHINPAEFDEDTRVRFEEFDEVIGLRKCVAKCFDSVVFIPESNCLVISIDLASKLKLDGIHLAAAKVARLANDLFARSGIELRLADNSANLFYCIDNFYEEYEGGVTEIAFATDDGFTHHEKIGATGEDIRENLFHKYGKTHSEIQAYRLGKRYHFGAHNDTAELFLPGSYRALGNIHGPSVYDAILRKSESVEAFSLLVNKLLRHKSRRAGNDGKLT